MSLWFSFQTTPDCRSELPGRAPLGRWADPNSGTGLEGSQRGGRLATFGSDITQRFLQSTILGKNWGWG